ncbi:hypothetical protein LJK88_26245 [Paenibacillus sp. P26]|nr:hypothetical protein LJK88_26245 [Paenibacillus sp. P26]
MQSESTDKIWTLIECSKIALKKGPEVWASPRLTNASQEDSLAYIQKCATELEQLRQEDPNIVFVIATESTLDLYGIVEGETIYQRMARLFQSKIENYNESLNLFLYQAVAAVRKIFKGTVTYAAGHWEKVNWEHFDVIGLNYYRNAYNSSVYREGLEKFIGSGKAVAVLEFGCGSYSRSQDKGAWSFEIIDWNQPRPPIKGNYTRDEGVQSDYIIELLTIFDEMDIFAAFVFEFIETQYPYDKNLIYDLDMASFGLVKVHSDGKWEPKKSFRALSEYYGG